jgi:hypothetical protein
LWDPDTNVKMTKTKQQKAARKAQRADARSALMAVDPRLGTAQAAARVTAKVARKQSKKKGSSPFWGILAGAAKVAGELAPVLAPLLLAKHGPSAANLQASGGAPAGGGGVPLATAASCATCTGIYGFKPKFGSDGRLNGIRMSGMDYLDALTVNGEDSGTQLLEIDLNPMSGAWAGTQAQRFASLFERYRPKRLAGLIEPSCPATTAGQLIAFIDPDADDDFPYSGRQAIQVASSHQGADVSQVWGMNVAGYGWDNRTQDYYADPDGSDERLISPGTWRVLANTDMPATTTIGSLYVVWEYEFVVPQLEELSTAGSYAFLTMQTGMTAAVPLGTDPWEDVVTEGALAGQLAATGPAGAVSHIYGLPPGFYFLRFFVTFTGGVSSIPTVSADGTNYVVNNTPVMSVTAAGDVEQVEFFLEVQSRSDAPIDGYVSLTVAGLPVVAPSVLEVFAYPGGLAAKRASKKKSLQDYEREIGRMREVQALLLTRVDQLAASQSQSAALAAYSSIASASTMTRR